MNDTLSKAELGRIRILKLSAKWVERLTSEGMPVVMDGRHPRYPVPGAVLWYIARKQQEVEARSAPTTLDEAKARREAALAQQEELKLAEMRCELMTVAQYRRVVDDTNARVAARLKTLPQKLAPAVVGVKDTAEGLARVQPLVDEVMDELWRADDVPTEAAA
jgi:phage terminase Nu1 subunit (DNA packaging protein)